MMIYVSKISIVKQLQLSNTEVNKKYVYCPVNRKRIIPEKLLRNRGL